MILTLLIFNCNCNSKCWTFKKRFEVILKSLISFFKCIVKSIYIHIHIYNHIYIYTHTHTHTHTHTRTHTYIHTHIYIYIYIHIWFSYWAKVFWFHIESWPKWDLNPQPCAYHAYALTIELSGRTMRCA